MRVPSGWVGRRAGPSVHEVDARWLMAYAAALGEPAPAYLDTCRPGDVAAHPLFPVCYEWPLAVALRAGMPAAVAARGVHAFHDLLIHRPPRAGDRLTTTAVVTRVTPRRPGALVVTRFETVDAAGDPVTTSDYGSLHLGVACEAEGGDADAVGEPDVSVGLGASPPAWSVAVPVAAGLAHVYTECARIWNPIHTDRAVARAAGLPDIILHGTATLALAVSEVVRREAGGDPARVRRVAARFGAMVLMPSTLTVQGLGPTETAEGPWVAFQALTAEGRPAVRAGRLLMAG